MTVRVRTPGLLALAAVLLLALLIPPAPAHADQAYDQVASAYAQAGGQLDPCAFTQTQLEAAIRGIPPAIRNVVPALRRAMENGVAAHERGDCTGRRAEEGTTGGAAAGGAGTTTPTATTPPVTAPQTQTAPAVPTSSVPTTQSAPTSTTPAPAAAAAQPATGKARDRTPLLVALVAAGALLLLVLLLSGWARVRGWDPGWFARLRHGWGEAGYRATSTWAEFTDWLRLGR